MPPLFLDLVCGSDGFVYLSQQSVYIHAMNSTGLLHSLATGSGTAQAMHADGQEDRSGLRGDGQDIADDGIFGDGHLIFLQIYDSEAIITHVFIFFNIELRVSSGNAPLLGRK